MIDFLVGIHGANKKFRLNPIPDGDWKLLALMRPGVRAFKGFSYYSENEWETAIRTINPVQVVIRINHEDDLPSLEAAYRSMLFGGIEVVAEILNEPNLEIGDVVAFIARYEAIESWLVANCPTWLICFPGLSPGVDPFRWWIGCREQINRARYLGVHLYYNQPGGYNQQQGILDVAKKLGKEILVTEFCYTGGEDGHIRPTSELAPEYCVVANWLSGQGVRAVYYYLLGSDDKHWEQVGETFDPTLAKALGGVVISMPTPAFHLGFLNYVNQHPEINFGTPISDENYDDFGNSWQYSDTGLLFWYKAANQVYWFEKTAGTSPN